MEILFDLFSFFTIMAFKDVCSFSCVKVLNQVSQRMFFNTFLQSVKEHGYEFLNILLHHYINWLSKRFVSNTKSTWWKVLSCSVFKVGKNSLYLMKQVIVNFFSFSIKTPFSLSFIISSQNQVSKSFIHKKLLYHTVHVTNIS